MKAKDFLTENVIGINQKALKQHHDFMPSIIKAMQEYAKAKCTEQREICQEIFDLTDAQIGNVYLNAPTPDFE